MQPSRNGRRIAQRKHIALISIVVTVWLLAAVSIVHSQDNDAPQSDSIPTDTALPETARETKVDSGPSARNTVAEPDSAKFFSTTLSIISVLLTIISLIIAAIVGCGFLFILRVSKERKQLADDRRKREKDYKAFQQKLKRDYKRMLEALKRVAFGLASVARAKAKLRKLLSDETTPDRDAVYKAIQATVRYPDSECLRLYGKALLLFENDVDIVRIVRSALMQHKSE